MSMKVVGAHFSTQEYYQMFHRSGKKSMYVLEMLLVKCVKGWTIGDIYHHCGWQELKDTGGLGVSADFPRN